MTNPAKDDEALVDAVASCEWERGRARGMYADMSWQKFRQISERMDGSLDHIAKPLLANARAAIAAVRAHDAERGMVTVPRAPTEEMRIAALNVTLPQPGEPPLYEKVWRAMIAAAKPDGDAA